MNVLSEECDLIQSELYRNSKSVLKRNDGVLYYDCTNYYFEIEQEDGNKIKIYRAFSDTDEGTFVANQIEKIKKEEDNM